ncbi:putative Rhodanese-like domain-containing protein [Seiridium cardinale]
MASKHGVTGALRSSAQLTARASPLAFRSFATASRAASTSRPRLSCSQAARPLAASTQRLAGTVRWSSESATGSKIYSFEELFALQMRSLLRRHNSGVHIIDVREPDELASTGKIPTAKNIPITTSPDSFHITPEEFQDRFGMDRPGLDEPVVFYCKAGVRSRAAAGIAREAGWKSVGEYPGSWVEWTGKGGRVERS